MPGVRRRYPRLKVAQIVGESEVEGLRPTARKHRIPPSTLQRWRNSPDMAQLRTEKREDVAADVWAAFQKGVRRIEELLPTTDDMGKVAVATGILYDKHALMSGLATNRTESRDLTDALDDHEKDALRAVLEQVIAASELPV